MKYSVFLILLILSLHNSFGFPRISTMLNQIADFKDVENVAIKSKSLLDNDKMLEETTFIALAGNNTRLVVWEELRCEDTNPNWLLIDTSSNASALYNKTIFFGQCKWLFARSDINLNHIYQNKPPFQSFVFLFQQDGKYRSNTL